MKTSVKILILFGAIVLAVGGVMLYMKVIMAPPMEMKTDNQYLAHLDQLTNSFRDSVDIDPEYNFKKYSDMTDRLYKEDLITPEEGQKNYCEYILVYAPKFTDWCVARFQEPVWKEATLNKISERVDFLNGIKNSDNAPLISTESPVTHTKLEEIKNTLANYNEAKKITNSGFSSLSDSRQRITKARRLMEDQYLKNNASIYSSLSNLPTKLEAGHYANLKSQVASMANYENKSRENFENLSNRIENNIREYETNANSTYGKISNVNDLRNMASRHYSAAEAHFNYLDSLKAINQKIIL